MATNVNETFSYDLSKELLNEFKNLKINQENEQDKKQKKKKKSPGEILNFLFKLLLQLLSFAIIFIYIFFKTNVFASYRDLWVVTAMGTMNHQYLATMFLTTSEIDEIMKSVEVINDENSDNSNIIIAEDEEEEQIEEVKKEITVEKITGKNYVGFVMQIPDASKVALVDSRKNSTGTKLSEICKTNDAIAGINAGGFADPNGSGYGNILCDPTIINGKLLYGSKSTTYSFIGLTNNKILSLGKYTYNGAIENGIENAVDFGPFLIVNGNNQISNQTSGGIHPRTAIGQKADGTFIFVVIDGRQPGYSLGCNLLELQNIFNRYGAVNAANLDGGSSSTMYYNGEIINKPSTPIGQRYLPNAFIVYN